MLAPKMLEKIDRLAEELCGSKAERHIGTRTITYLCDRDGSTIIFFIGERGGREVVWFKREKIRALAPS